MLALISQEEDSDSKSEDKEEEEPIQPRYNLRSHQQHTVNEAIFEESPNVTTTKSKPTHSGRFNQATKLLQITEAYKTKMYLPIRILWAPSWTQTPRNH